MMDADDLNARYPIINLNFLKQKAAAMAMLNGDKDCIRVEVELEAGVTS